MFNLLSWIKKRWGKQNISSFNPQLDCLKAIEDKPSIPGEYECYQKSRDASKCLKKHGYDAIPTCGPVKGLERHHCWVEIKHGGEIYWYDPTWINEDARYGFWKASQYTDREIFRPEHSEKIKYPIEKNQENQQ